MILKHILLFALIILLKGLFTATETAFNIADRKKDLSDNMNSPDILDAFDKVSDKFRNQLAAINIINAVLVMGLGFLCTSELIRAVMKDIFNDKIFISEFITFILVFIVIFILLTYFLVLFGAIIPKRLARRNYKAVLQMTKVPVAIVRFLAFPLALLINISVNLINVFFDTAPKEDVTQEEILQMLDVGEETGTIDENEKEMINNIFEFDDKTAGEIATHRKEIVAISIDATADDIVKVVMEEKYSRIPVYKDSIDNIVGILHIKDVLKHLVHFGKDDFDLDTLMMKPFFVPFTKKTDELFEEMQKKKIHMAIVIDEYGGTAGIVTMEDLIEEVMGNILDEYDEEETPEIQKINDETYLISGTAEIDDVEDELGISLQSDEFDTIGGFLISKIGKIPDDDEHINIEYEGYSFRLEKVEEKRIMLVKAVKIHSEDIDNKEEN